MKSLGLGVFGIALFIGYAVVENPKLFLQTHSIVLVAGGTILVFLLSTPASVIKIIFKTIRSLHFEERLSSYRDEFIALTKNRSLTAKSKNFLISYAQDLWDQGIDQDLFTVLLSQKRMELENETIDAVQALKNMAKYPPALGMIGTVIGMIGLFAQLDQKSNQVGENLALAMTATFFGLVLANAIISPLADRLQVRHVYSRRLYMNIYQILLLINQGEPMVLINGELDERSA